VTKSNDILFLMEYSIFPELVRGLQDDGHVVMVEHLARKAMSWLKKSAPKLLVAEFYHDPNFRDRVSNLESVLAHVQRHQPDTKVLVLYPPNNQDYVDRLIARFPVAATQTLPIEVDPCLQQVGALLRADG
jgi:DNA-binding NarL/FixJ family response regulator